MVKEGGSDVIKVPEEGEEAASEFVVPHLGKTGIFTQFTLALNLTIIMNERYMF